MKVEGCLDENSFFERFYEFKLKSFVKFKVDNYMLKDLIMRNINKMVI